MDLALTLDYELYGDGSGNMFSDVIEPTKKLLDACNTNNIKLTIFFEVVEYWKLEEEWQSGNKMGYREDPVQAMKEQIIEAYIQGHEIQLHIHPQWINAEYVEDAWKVDEHWSMADIPLTANPQFSMTLDEVFKKGISILEDILHPIDKNYKCNIFRAGGFNILPSENIVKVLNKYNFIIDSSVFSGGYENSMKSNYDYREIDKNIPYWVIEENDVLLQYNQNIASGNMIEIPIFALPIYRVLKYDLTRLKAIFNNKKSAIKTIKGRTAKKSFIQKILFYFEKESLTWDFCLFSISKMKYFYKSAKKHTRTKYHPHVLIGHSKGYYSDEGLKFLAKQKDIRFYIMTDLYEQIKSTRQIKNAAK